MLTLIYKLFTDTVYNADKKRRDEGWAKLSEDEKAALLGDKLWRMNHLYYIRDKKGNKVLFQMNEAQLDLFIGMWFMNIILKARQMGFTTFIDLYFLDESMFNKGIECGIIAHNLVDAGKIFRRKIQYPYDNLPEEIRAKVRPVTDSKTELELSNGSVISVGVSFRSGTAQYLHISEFGKICAANPKKAREIVTGALEAIEAGQIVFIESTAEGRGGYFYNYCQTARKLAAAGIALTELDYKFHFFPWWGDKNYRLENPERVLITDEMAEYFNDLLRQHGIELDAEQKAWYVKKHEKLLEDMKREHPSTPDEAFEAVIQGAYFSKLISAVRQRRQIGHVPHDPALPVHTAWDLGRNDANSIWFFQYYGNQYLIIDYIENSGESLNYYAGELAKRTEKLGYQYDRHFLPHDVGVTDISQPDNQTRQQVLENLGMKNIVKVKRELDLDAGVGVAAVRGILPRCWFDAKKCDRGLAGLEAYQKEYDEKNATYKKRPLHNWASNPADAFKILARGFTPFTEYSQSDVEPDDDGIY